MARNPVPGWYPVPEGGERRWDGATWTVDRRPPTPPQGTPSGWHRDTTATEIWWTGQRWSEARRADDGHIDAARSMGQAIIAISVMGGTNETAVAKLTEALRDYPPCRIEQLNTEHSSFVAGTNLIALVSWQ